MRVYTSPLLTWTIMTDSLTGVWDGTYTQPGVGIVTFLATLIESGGALGGSVTEPCATPGCPLSTHNASVAGHRSGSAVSFVKRYEPPGYGYDTVSYEGTVNADATEIDGRWKLPGTTTSGTFLMVRATQPAQSVATEEQSKEPTR
jgi:hypothetical protein